MKKILTFLSCLLVLTSCSRYTQLSYDKYQILQRDANLNKIKCKLVEPVSLRLEVPDTVVSSVNSKGVAEFNNITRYIDPISANQQVKIVDFTEKSFTVEFVNYKLFLPFVKKGNGEFAVLTERNGIIKGSNYIIDNNNLTLIFKIKSKSTNQKINLKK